jgi:hypothetical protein
MAPQQTAPPQTRRQTLSAQKILVPERGILSDAYLLGLHHQPGQQDNVEMTNLDRSSESALQMRDQVTMDAVGARQNRGPDLCGDQKRQYQ